MTECSNPEDLVKTSTDRLLDLADAIVSQPVRLKPKAAAADRKIISRRVMEFGTGAGVCVCRIRLFASNAAGSSSFKRGRNPHPDPLPSDGRGRTRFTRWLQTISQ